jgi:tetratricopeptide (TPR) repeat protein
MNNLINEIEKLKLEGNKLFSHGKLDEAYKAFSKAISLFSNCNNETTLFLDENKKLISILYSNRANSLINLKKFEDAKTDAENCIKYRPEWYKGYLRLGLALYKLNFTKESLETLKTALEKTSTPEESNEINNLIETLFKTKKKTFLEAIKDENDIDESERATQEQYDWLMSQFIKPYEDDAFRALSAFHGVNDCELTKESARMWIKFGEKYGTGDCPELLLALKKFITLPDDSQELEDQFNAIYDLCGIL